MMLLVLSTTEPKAFQRWTRWEGTPLVGDGILFDPPRRAKEASQRARGWHLARIVLWELYFVAPAGEFQILMI